MQVGRQMHLMLHLGGGGGVFVLLAVVLYFLELGPVC